MIASRNDNLQVRKSLTHLRQKIVEPALSYRRRIDRVKNIPRNNHRVGTLGLKSFQQPLQKLLMLVVAIKTKKRLPQVPVCSVKNGKHTSVKTSKTILN